MLQWIQNTDNILLNFIQFHFHSPILDKALPFISMIGNLGAVWLVIAAILLCIPRYRKYGIMIVLAILLAALTGEAILKPMFARIRPCNLNIYVPMLIQRPTDFSFPSGHTSASFAATSIIWKANKKFGVLALLFALLMGFSRLYLYVHYPTDILAGLILGLLCGATIIYIVGTISRKTSSVIK